MPENLENSAVATGLEKVSFHSNPKEGQCQRMFKWLHNCTHFTWWQSNAQNPSSLKSRLQQYVKQELADVQAVFRKGRGTKDKIVNIHCIIEKAREFQKNIYFCFIDYTKAFDFVDYNKLWKILQEMGIPNHLTCLLWSLYASQEATVRTGHGTMDWFQIGKGVHQGCILSPCLFNLYAEYMMWNVLGWMKHKLESRLPREISITSDMQMIPPLWQKWRASWWRWKGRVKKLA